MMTGLMFYHKSLKLKELIVISAPAASTWCVSHQEISEATGMPLGTVKTHARRGILQVREYLGLGGAGLSQEVRA